MSINLLKYEENRINSFIKDKLEPISLKMEEKTKLLIEEYKFLNNELKEILELENEIKNKETSNLKRQNELINLERKLNEKHENKTK
jgi:hypothetical protein